MGSNCTSGDLMICDLMICDLVIWDLAIC